MISKIQEQITSSLDSPELPLRNNIHLLGDLLGKLLKYREGQDLFNKIETIRGLAKQAHEGSSSAAQQLVEFLQQLTTKEMLVVVRAFSHFLNLANIAENIHRIRRARAYQRNPQALEQPGSIAASFADLVNSRVSKDKIYQTALALNIDLVLTAHPTEVTRRTVMQKYDKIATTLLALDNPDNTPLEITQHHDQLEREITATWLTSELRAQRPTPLEEAKWGFAVIESSLWQAIPEYLRILDAKLQQYTSKSLPLKAKPICFS